MCPKRYALKIFQLVLFALAVDIAGAESQQEHDHSSGVECYVGQYRARVVPERTRVFVAPVAGTITGIINNKGRITKGTVLAMLNKTDLQLEKAELDLATLKDKADKEEEISKLYREKEELQFIMNLPKQERRYLTGGNKENNTANEQRIIATIDNKIALLEKELKTGEEKRNAEFAKKEESHIIKMPFDGRFQYSFTDTEISEEEAYIESGKEIVAVCDDSAFYMVIIVSTPELNPIMGNSFRLVADLGTGETIEASFSHKRIQNNPSNSGNSETVQYFFKLRPEDNERAFGLVGYNCAARLYYMGDENVVSFSKMELASMPEAVQAPTWPALLQRVKPGYELVLVGETQIIARKK